MPRCFNTTGACDPRIHYRLPPEGRLPGLMAFVEREQYFDLHAARQTGKTTALHAFAARLRGMGYAAIRATLEECQGFGERAPVAGRGGAGRPNAAALRRLSRPRVKITGRMCPVRPPSPIAGLIARRS